MHKFVNTTAHVQQWRLCATVQVKYKSPEKRQDKFSAYTCKDYLTDLSPPLVPLYMHFSFIQTNTAHWNNSIFYSNIY